MAKVAMTRVGCKASETWAMTPIILDPKPVRVPMDQVTKRILRRLASNVAVDMGAIAKEIGASEEVVRSRVGAMQDGGLLQGFNVRLAPDLLGHAYEYLVSGAPSEATDRQAIGRLCAAGGVTRVFGLASAHSVAFTVVGSDPAATQRRGLDLARQAGLVQPQAILIVNTFHDGAASVLPEALADAVAA